MSIVVAVRKNDTIALSTDTMMMCGSHKETADNLVNASKVIKAGSSLIAITGWSLYGNILDHYLHRRKSPRLSNEREIFAFFNVFWRHLKESYSFVNDRAEDAPFSDLDATFLVANTHGIFEVSGNMTVMRFRKYCAIGSGDQYAYGVLYTLYDSRRSALQLSRRAVEAAIHFHESCGGEIASHEVG